MKKSRFIEEMNNVIAKNNRLHSKCVELEKTVAEKDRQIAELAALCEQLSADVDILKAEVEAGKLAQSVVVEMPEDRLYDEDGVEYVEAETDDEPVVTPLLSEPKMKAASESIGRVVLQCAELCNIFAAAGDVNSMDLINLALGRTEVFKSDVLQLASEDISLERLTAELASREAAVSEYFELLSYQL